MQPTEKIAQTVSELHALMLLSQTDKDAAAFEIVRVQVALDDFAAELPELTRHQIGEAARRGVQRVVPVAYA